MEKTNGVIIQGDSLFYFDHQPLCKFLAKAKNKVSDSMSNPEAIWKKISQLDSMYYKLTNTPNPLENYNKGGSLESFFEDIKRVLFVDKLDYEEFSHIWHNSVYIPSSRTHRLVSKIKAPIVAVVNTNHAHWGKVRNYFERNINCHVLSFESKMTMPSTVMLFLAHKQLGERFKNILNPIYLGSKETHLVAMKLDILAYDVNSQNLPQQLENLGII